MATSPCHAHTPDDLAPAGVSICQAGGGSLRSDILVVGSGPGGAITATLLAEAGREVILLEEGGWVSQEQCLPFSRDEMIRTYRHGGITAAMGRPALAYVEACCVGGGSEINAGLYHRTPPDILAAWRRDWGVEALTPEDLEPHFVAGERELGVIHHPGDPAPSSHKLRIGAERLGWRAMEVPRWYSYQPLPVGANNPDGKRFSEQRNAMSRTFIPRFRQAGGQLIARLRVDRIRKRSGLWEVVAMPTCAATKAAPVVFLADTLFLAAGTIGTPTLLRRNLLSRRAGNTFASHPTIKITARFPEVVNPPGSGIGVHQVKGFSPRFGFGCAVSSPPYLAMGMIDHPRDLPLIAHESERMAIYYAMARGQGRVVAHRLLPQPIPFWRMTPVQWQDLTEALHKLAQLLFEAGADTLWPTIAGSEPLNSRADLARLPALLPAHLTRLMTIHLTGSCPMGSAAKGAVTDSFGRVHGQEGLYVCDASLLCDAPGVNPQGSLMALVRRNALRFLGQA
ncbi:MAG: GMC family oxidoreductase [Magnetococcales bacterium]|nr:GMC family oxidoreductase [Magnetococcales bacterium]